MDLSWIVAGAAFLVAVLAGAWALRLRSAAEAADAQLRRARRENENLRESFGKVAGWTPDGRLPQDWPEILKARLAPAPVPAASDGAVAADMLAAAVRDALAAVPPPLDAAGSRRDDVARAHERAVGLFDAMTREAQPLLPALANGDLDDIFGLWLRLDAYFPAVEQRVAYMLAASVLALRLGSEGVRLHAPRLLGGAGHEEAELTTDDRDGLKSNHAVRSLATAAAARFAPASAGERMVVDCLSPGWSGPAGGRRPRLLVWDRSWQE